MALMTYHTLRKTYFYNFYPSKAEEEASKANSTPTSSRHHRMLVEMRDVHPPPVLDPSSPWQIKKTLNHYEIASGKIVVSFHDTFEYILRYWNFCMANHIAVLGHRVAVILWDVTNEKKPKKYEGNDVYFQITPSENCILTCMEMMRDRRLKVDDYIGLYWDSREANFRIKLFYSNTR
ncbi:hypothetical protein Salat_2642000 [Sesamum alatum]|uniref:B3 domain-containing protein n=1 Tax=Sesamum alatum TaxID=300844 RepID=A0AAE1XP02_9LAMI|nr:hypothetical protein Salat_2642000 [Sesamum alatum]